jgi:hypothetical protein
MKKLLLILIVLVFTNLVFGQDRVNRPKLSFEGTSEILSTSVGWHYNKTLGEWIDYPNVISKDDSYKTRFKSLAGPYLMSKSLYTFNTLQVKSFTFNNTKYYALIVDKWSGRYRYPTIEEDWIQFKNIDCYILTESEYSKLQNYEKVTFITYVPMNLEFEGYSETKLLDLIQTKLLSYNGSNPSSIKDLMYITKTSEDKIRFLTPHYYFTSREEVDFNNIYFETDKDSFDKLIIR